MNPAKGLIAHPEQGNLVQEPAGILDCFWASKIYYSQSQKRPLGCQSRGHSDKRSTSSYMNFDPVTSLRENRDFPTQADDPRLVGVVDAWPELPEAIRAGILAMVGRIGKSNRPRGKSYRVRTTAGRESHRAGHGACVVMIATRPSRPRLVAMPAARRRARGAKASSACCIAASAPQRWLCGRTHDPGEAPTRVVSGPYLQLPEFFTPQKRLGNLPFCFGRSGNRRVFGGCSCAVLR